MELYKKANLEWVYSNSKPFYYPVMEICRQYWKKAGNYDLELELMQNRIRFNLKVGAIVFTKNRQIDRFNLALSSDERDKIQYLDKWKVGCRAVLTAGDSETVTRIIESIGAAIRNEQGLKLPVMNAELRETLLNEYNDYLQKQKDVPLENNMEMLPLPVIELNAFYNQLVDLNNEMGKITSSLENSLNSIESTLRDHKKGIEEMENYMGILERKGLIPVRAQTQIEIELAHINGYVEKANKLRTGEIQLREKDSIKRQYNYYIEKSLNLSIEVIEVYKKEISYKNSDVEKIEQLIDFMKEKIPREVIRYIDRKGVFVGLERGYFLNEMNKNLLQINEYLKAENKKLEGIEKTFYSNEKTKIADYFQIQYERIMKKYNEQNKEIQKCFIEHIKSQNIENPEQLIKAIKSDIPEEWQKVVSEQCLKEKTFERERGKNIIDLNDIRFDEDKVYFKNEYYGKKEELKESIFRGIIKIEVDPHDVVYNEGKVFLKKEFFESEDRFNAHVACGGIVFNANKEKSITPEVGMSM